MQNISSLLCFNVWIKGIIITYMAVISPKSFLPIAEDVLNADLSRLGGILLIHLKSYEGAGTIYQGNGGFNRDYCFAMMDRIPKGLGPLPSNEPEYGNRQAEVTRAFREAWNWLEREGHLMHTPGQPSLEWFSLARSGEEEECYLGTAMLTRGLLDHVPPVFGMKSFSEVANNYAGGGKSFKGTMQHLESGARNIADSHLHGQIRRKETLPEPQQVDFRAGLDALLAEIVRITQ